MHLCFRICSGTSKLFLGFFFLFSNADAQNCCTNYISSFFNQVSVETVQYATNLPNANGGLSSVFARVWTASEDTCSKKPLVIFVHGGGFTAGYPELMDSLCRTFAQRGFVAASISYRLGWIGSSTCPVDSAETYRAWYRAMQDCKTAIRYFRYNAEQFSVDTSTIFLGGWSAGGYAAIGAAYCDLDFEKPIVCGEISPLEWNGTSYPRPDLGGVNSGPYENQSNSILGVVSISAAVFQPQNLVQGAHPALLSFNNTLDPYSIPINSCSAWWNYNNCSVFPEACGVEGLSAFIQEAGIEFNRITYTSNTCAHNLHDPCFPSWEDEVSVMLNFFIDKMGCSNILGNANESADYEILNKKSLFVFNPMEKLPVNTSTIYIFDSMGKLVSNKPAAPKNSGFYIGVWNEGFIQFIVSN
jgi:hypothetical protein